MTTWLAIVLLIYKAVGVLPEQQSSIKIQYPSNPLKAHLYPSIRKSGPAVAGLSFFITKDQFFSER